jgi:hypothetical protein
MSIPGPIRDSYWLLDGLLLAGEYPGSWTRHGAEARLALFLDVGIRTFIDLTRDTEPLEPYEGALARLAVERNVECRYWRLPIEDMGVPSRELMTKILRTIGDELDKGRPVYVHCWGGIGRTGTVAGCWLVEAGCRRRRHSKKCRPFEPISEMLGGGPFGLKPGQWTDDTSMMLCLRGESHRNRRLRRARSAQAVCALVAERPSQQDWPLFRHRQHGARSAPVLLDERRLGADRGQPCKLRW